MSLGYKHKPGGLRILVLGYIVRGPMGGMTWHHLQYVLGLRQLGHDVFFLEDSGDTEYSCYDPKRNVTDADPTFGLAYIRDVFKRVDMADRWAYYDHHTGNWKGPISGNVKAIIASADLLLNLSCSNPIRLWLEDVPVRVLIDTDPVFTQIRNLTDNDRNSLCRKHNVFFTFGENYGKENCTIPVDGFPWKPTRQPVVMQEWPLTKGPGNGNFSTVMKWESYPGKTYNGQYFGMKSESFTPFIDLPSQTKQTLELSMSDHPEVQKELHKKGWKISNSLQLSSNPWAYQKFIQSSKGEFSIAKHGYVQANTGWFSERSTAYLASGRPVICQDTGFGETIKCGEGLVAFKTVDEAVAGLEKVNKSYEKHCKKARDLVEEYFNSKKVLDNLLNEAIKTHGSLSHRMK